MSGRARGVQRDRLLAQLRSARKSAGLTQAELARQLKRPQSFVSKYESGERRLDILELRDICNALGIGLIPFVKRLDRVLDT
jgi:transcriptional regulator with XRE-family HTH domain